MFKRVSLRCLCAWALIEEKCVSLERFVSVCVGASKVNGKHLCCDSVWKVVNAFFLAFLY